MFKKILVLALLTAFMFSNAYGGTVIVTSAKHTTWGNKRVTMGIVAMSGAYSATAFNMTAAKCGMNVIEKIVFVPYDYTSAMYSPYFYSGTNYINLYQNKYNSAKPSISAPVASDTFKVYGKALTAVDAETCNVFVVPTMGQLARFITPGICTGLVGTDLLHQSWTYADSSSLAGVMADSSGATVVYRGTGYKGGDTLFYDYNATNRGSKFFYTGNVCGNLGSLYVPTGGGHFVKVGKSTNTALIAAGAYPAYFLRSAGLDDKWMVDITGTATPTTGVMVDSTYTSLVQYLPVETTVQTGKSISMSYYFIAIGN